MIGGSNVDLILSVCDQGGMLLQPDRPATELDSYFTKQVGVVGGCMCGFYEACALEYACRLSPLRFCGSPISGLW